MGMIRHFIKKRVIKQSVATRTALLVLFMVSFIMLIGGFYQIGRVRSYVKNETETQARRAMDGAVARIDSRISNVETAVHTAAAFADRSTQSKTLCYEMLYRLISKNSDIAAATLLYRADYFPELGRYYAPTVVRDPITGQLEADEIGGIENDFDYLETDSNWIYTNLLERGYWCLPYVDSMSTKRAMVTYSVPLYDAENSLYAVLCADVALDWVSSIVEEAKPYDYSRVIVLSRDSQYVCHPDPAWIQSVNIIDQAQSLKDSDYLHLAHQMLSWQRGSDTLQEDITISSLSDQRRDEKTIIYFAPVDRVKWSISFSMPESKIMKHPNELRRSMILLLVFMLALISVVLVLIIRAQIWPLTQLSLAAHEIAIGHFDKTLPIIRSHDEIRHLRDSFEEMQTSLANYIDELQRTTTATATIANELKVASGIQMAMLPKQFPPYPERNDIKVFGTLVPAKAVGGDLYDFFIRDEKLFFCIGDVSGKGVPASLVMAVSIAIFRTIASREAMPDRILTQMNETLSHKNDSNMFVTLFIGVIDLPSGRLRYSNAGHDAPLLVGETVETLPCDSNVPAGIMPGWKFTVQETMIQPFTTIFMFTDGITEATNNQFELYGEQRVLEQTQKSLAEGKKDPDSLVSDMSASVNAFVGDAEQSDDQTMLAVQYTKERLTEVYQHAVSLTNDVNEVPQLATFVDEVCEAVGFDMGTTMQINLAMEEAVVNVMNYAYPKGTKGDILVEATSNAKRLKFTIIDSGKPFDPTAKAEVDITLAADERPIGGLGIHLVRQIMDSINYEYLNGQNVLTLRKQLTS